MTEVDLKGRIEERLAATGKAVTRVATEIGRGRDFINDILKGRKSTLPSDTITPLAIALECDERYFTDPSFTTPGHPRRSVTQEALDRYKAAAGHGVYALAWRDYRRLQLQDVALESGLTPGTVSDIEQGLLAPNAEQLTALAKAFSTNAGLLRNNPFETSNRIARLVSITEDLDPHGQSALIDMAEVLRRRQAG